LDDVKVPMAASAQQFHGLEIGVRRLSGARALRVVHPAHQIIAPHRHDWPLLTIPALGGYLEEDEKGIVSVEGPAVILHPAGCHHANGIHQNGMETFSIEFDPAWLSERFDPSALGRSHYWIGGGVSHSARALARLWSSSRATDAELCLATTEFLSMAFSEEASRPPEWLGRARQELVGAGKRTAADLGQALGLHPRWVAHAYRLATGEGLHETVRRRRLEQAVQMLRATDDPIAEIAAACGFCDQSHLNRTLRSLTGRTPLQVRAERAALAELSAAGQAWAGDRAPSPS
jgi:AraC family transcriptional regulator